MGVWTCTCPAFNYHRGHGAGSPCKHIIATKESNRPPDAVHINYRQQYVQQYIRSPSSRSLTGRPSRSIYLT